MKLNYRHTVLASYIGYITQAIINNLPALLFVTFNTHYGIPLEKIGLLVTINFGIQILIDLLAARYIDRIGYRVGVVAAHVFAVAGLILLGILPRVMADAYAGLVIAMVLNAVGGGLIEVLISPIVESVPGDAKASAMSLLHSFYCWGHVAVVVLSTLYFSTVGIARWHLLPFLWAAVPLFNIFFFARVPLRVLVEESERVPLRKLFAAKTFLILFVLMICAGASEQAMSQWSSLFAESGLRVSKTMGDLLGPCMFATLMGLSRLLYGVFGARLNIRRGLMGSALLCIVSYLIAVLSPQPGLSLVGCGLCGLSVGLMWPGTFSLAAATYPQGGTAMFAILALAGDVGCAGGPGLVGLVSGLVERLGDAARGWFYGAGATEAGLKAGLTLALAFPVLMAVGLTLLRRTRRARP